MHKRLPIKSLLVILALCLSFTYATSRLAQDDGLTISPTTVREHEQLFQARQNRVSWPEADGKTYQIRNRLSDTALSAIDAASVPVLLPDSDELLSRASVISKPNWVAVSITTDNHSISINVTRISFDIGELEMESRQIEHPTMNGDIRSIRTFYSESVWNATWEELGASYLVSLGCAVEDDAKCKNDVYLRTIIDSLVFAGGGGDW